MSEIRVFLALGSNLDPREKYLADAVTAIENCRQITIRNLSSIYETEPKYNTDQPDFLNMVIEIGTPLDPAQLLAFCKNTETKLGRRNSIVRNSPREIDLDIIFYDRKIIDTPTLKIPHPGLYERKFVLVPLAEIAPEFACPKTGISVAELLNACPDTDRVDRIGQIDEILTFPVSIGVL